MSGVYFDKKRNKFIARATINGKRTYLGQKDTRYEAEYLVLQYKQLFTESTTSSFQHYYLPELVCDIDQPSLFSRVKSFFTKGL